MAKQRRRPVRRRDRKGAATSSRRKPCPYCREKIAQVDYKDISALRRFISDRGKIRSRRITVFGRQAKSCAQYLKKGRPVAVDGRLEWSSWERDGQRRESIDIIADSVQFLGGRDDAGNGNGFSSSIAPTESDVQIDTGDFETAPVGAAAAEDDIPF